VSAASPGRRRELARALALAGFGFAAVLLEAAPAGVAALSLPSPDLLFCVVAVWAIRSPGAAPLVLVFALGLLRDLVTDVPPGLGALTLVGAAEALKARAGALRRQPFLAEWLWVALACAVMTALQWLGLLVSFAQPPYGMLLAQQVTVTAAVYPLFVLLVGRTLSPRDRRGA